jgi:putative spermidine/putrescine transport system ATP-binding protein
MSATAEETVVWFSVRRDQIELASASQGLASIATEPSAVCGTVQAIEYQGSYVKMTIHRSGHEDVIAHMSDRGFFPMQVQMGDRVVVRWLVEDVHLLRSVGGRVDRGAVDGHPYDEAFDVPPR